MRCNILAIKGHLPRASFPDCTQTDEWARLLDPDRVRVRAECLAERGSDLAIAGFVESSSSLLPGCSVVFASASASDHAAEVTWSVPLAG